MPLLELKDLKVHFPLKSGWFAPKRSVKAVDGVSLSLDKGEIITYARRYGTFETSILPFEDCCTVFTPKHPKTQPKIELVMKELEKVDFDALLEEAYASMYTETKKVFESYK